MYFLFVKVRDFEMCLTVKATDRGLLKDWVGLAKRIKLRDPSFVT